MQHLQRLRGRRCVIEQSVIDGAEDQGERRAQLVADVAEEGSFGEVKIREFYGATFFGFVGFNVSDTGGDLSGGEFKETGVAGIDLAVGIESSNEYSCGFFLSA